MDLTAMSRNHPSPQFLVTLTLVLFLFCSKFGEGEGVKQFSTTNVNVLSEERCSVVQGLHANLIRFITKEGFHRDLEDTVEITITNSPIPMKDFVTGQCIFGLLAKLSADVYVDPYEILHDTELREYIRVLNNWTDLENPAWLTKSNSTIFIQLKPVLTGNLISTEQVRLPIHYRYQKPMSHSRMKHRGGRNSGVMNPAGYTPVTLPLPQLILRCEDWDTSRVTDDCQTMRVICDRKSPKSSECTWAVVPYKANAKSGTVYIPVGDSDSQVLITVVTTCVVLGGMVFVLFTLVRATQVTSRAVVETTGISCACNPLNSRPTTATGAQSRTRPHVD